MKLISVLLENKLDDAIAKYGNVVNSSTLNQLYSGDPSESKKYFNWMVNQWINNQSISPSKVVNVVELFHQNINKITSKNLESISGLSDRILSNPKDINSYSLEELNKVVEAVGNIKSKSEIKHEGTDVIYEDDRWLVVSPLTREASCYYGANTKWCTAAKENNQFDRYNSTGLLIYFLDKSRSSGNYYKMALNVDYRGEKRWSTWYNEEDEEFAGWKIIELLPQELYKNVNSYIDSRLQSGFKAYTHAEIRDILVKTLSESTIKTAYGSLVPFHDAVAGSLTWDMDTNMSKNFPDIKEFYIMASPLWNDQLTIPIDYHIEYFSGKEIVNGYNESYEMSQYWVSYLMGSGEKTEHQIMRGITILTTIYKKAIKSFFNELTNSLGGLDSEIKSWEPNNSRSSFVFKYPPKKNGMTSLFVKYVVRRQRRNLPATKRDFYKTVLGYKINVGNLDPEEFAKISHGSYSPTTQEEIKKRYGTHVYNPTLIKMIDLSGHNTIFFASITDSGILKREGSFYTLGPNYEAWTKGLLKK